MHRTLNITRLTVLGFLLNLVGIFLLSGASTAYATGLPVQYVGDISADQTWTSDKVYYIQGNARLMNEATLTIQPGVIVKLAYNASLQVDAGSSVYAVGTSSQPIIFTSYRDDAHGGDSNQDGNSQGGPGDFASVFRTNGGSVTAQFTIMQFGTNSVTNSGCGPNVSVILTDSVIRSGINLGCTDIVGNSMIARNTFEITEGVAIDLWYIDPSIVALFGTDTNQFNGTGQAKAVKLYGTRVPSDKTWHVAGGSGAVVHVQSQSLDVRGTVTLEPGAIVKVSAVGSHGIKVREDGHLNVVGTASNKVVFTSFQDDSYGGDTNGDGTTSPDPSYAGDALYIQENGAVTIEFAMFQHLNGAVHASCHPGTPSLALSDSDVKAPVRFSHCGPGAVTLQRNQINVSGLQHYAIEACGADMSGVLLAGTNKNVLAGNDKSRAIAVTAGKVSENRTWSVDGSSNAVVVLTGVTCGNSASGLEIRGTLSLGAGAIFKQTYDGKVSVVSGGNLSISGTSTSKVQITSLKDDTVGGDTNGDAASVGVIGDYNEALKTSPGSTVDINHAEIRYPALALSFQNDASIAHTKISSSLQGATISTGNVIFENVIIEDVGQGLSVSGDATVTYRGNFVNVSGKRIIACKWDMACQVDAAYTDWGEPTGPDVTPLNGNVCGAVVYSPWRYGGAPYESSNFSSNCDGTSPFLDFNQAAQQFQDRINDKQIDCSNGFQDACDQIETAMACLAGAVNVAASTSPFPLPEISETWQIESFPGMVKNAAIEKIRNDLIAELVTPEYAQSLKGMISSLVGTFFELNSAYASCKPQ